ncbi:MAG: hypothetical protein AB7U61_17915 [Methylocystis sp.]
MSAPPKKDIKTRVAKEAKDFLPVFLYLWFLLAVLGVYKSIVLSQAHIVEHQGFAVAKALAFAKVLFVANKFGVWRVFDKMPLVVPILAKSFLFGVLLIDMDMIEQALLEHFWPSHADHDGLDLGNLSTLISVALVTFSALIPFFGYREFSKLIGEEEMHKVVFVRRESFVPRREFERLEAQAPAETVES